MASMIIDDHVSEVLAHWERERPDLDASPIGIVGRMHRIAARLTPELTAVYAQHDLLEGEFDVLATLRRLGDPFETSAGRLASQTMVTTGAMSKRLDRLERAGLVTRRVSGVDGRGRVIALTEKGRAIIDAAFTDHVANEHRLVEAMSADDRLALAGILGRWSTRLEQSLPAGS